MLPLAISFFFTFLELTMERVIAEILGKQRLYQKKTQEQEKKLIPKAPPTENEQKITNLEQNIKQLVNEIQQMEVECNRLNTPQTFAQCSKLQRQINAKKNQLQTFQQELSEIPVNEKTETVEQQTKVDNNKQDEEKKKIQQYALLAQFGLLVILLILVKGTYYRVYGIGYTQLYPVSYLIAKQDDGEEYVDISLFIWSVQSFNILRIAKKMLGYDVL